MTTTWIRPEPDQTFLPLNALDEAAQRKQVEAGTVALAWDMFGQAPDPVAYFAARVSRGALYAQLLNDQLGWDIIGAEPGRWSL